MNSGSKVAISAMGPFETSRGSPAPPGCAGGLRRPNGLRNPPTLLLRTVHPPLPAGPRRTLAIRARYTEGRQPLWATSPREPAKWGLGALPGRGRARGRAWNGAHKTAHKMENPGTPLAPRFCLWPAPSRVEPKEPESLEEEKQKGPPPTSGGLGTRPAGARGRRGA